MTPLRDLILNVAKIDVNILALKPEHVIEKLKSLDDETIMRLVGAAAEFHRDHPTADHGRELFSACVIPLIAYKRELIKLDDSILMKKFPPEVIQHIATSNALFGEHRVAALIAAYMLELSAYSNTTHL